MDLEKTVRNLQNNNMSVMVVQNGAEALQAVKSLLPPGATVTHGGSVTLTECGVTDLLKSGAYRYLDRSTDAENVYRETMSADVFLTSSNAVTENGELYNVDGHCNRIAAIAFGPKKVVVLASVNKIVPTLADAVRRVKTVAAPKNAQRLHCKTYCAAMGQCVSLTKEDPEMTDGCDSPQRICRNYLVSAKQQDPDRITVILIREKAGY